jgi:thiol-disulfide isomerase/thioredoxin
MDSCEVKRMGKTLWFILGAVGIVAAYSIFGSLFGGKASPKTGVSGPASLVGAPAASYSVKRLDGANDALDRYRGQVVVANLWASWCAPCREETPALAQLYNEERGRGLVVLGINQGESAEAARAFVREQKLAYPILLDEEQRYGRAFGSVGLPTTVFVDRGGRVVEGVDGPLTLEQMRAKVAPLLAAR